MKKGLSRSIHVKAEAKIKEDTSRTMTNCYNQGKLHVKKKERRRTKEKDPKLRLV